MIDGDVIEELREDDQIARVGDQILVRIVIVCESQKRRIAVVVVIKPARTQDLGARFQGCRFLAGRQGVGSSDGEVDSTDVDGQLIYVRIIRQVKGRTPVREQHRLDLETVDIGAVDDDFRHIIGINEDAVVFENDARGLVVAAAGAHRRPHPDAGTEDVVAVVDDVDVLDDAVLGVVSNEVGGAVNARMLHRQLERRIDDSEIADPSGVVGEHRVIRRQSQILLVLPFAVDGRQEVVVREVKVADLKPAAVEGPGEDVVRLRAA